MSPIRRRRSTAPRRKAATTASGTSTSAAAKAAGAMTPTVPGISSVSIGISAARPPGIPPRPVTAAFNIGTTSEGPIPSTTQASASPPIAACMLRGTSRASAARGVRGIARNVIPKAFTKHAAASPLVSASIPTAMAMMRPSSGRGSCGPPRSAWKTSHSETNPLSGGNPEIAAAPTRKQKAVRGIPLMSPPSSSMLRVWVA